MFASTSALNEQRVAAVHRQVAALNEQAESWFDGTPNSVDSRIALTTRVRNASREIESCWGIASALDDELSKLAEFRDDVLASDQLDSSRPVTASAGKLSAFGREFVATHLNTFIEDNREVISSAEELDIRATNYVDAHVAGRPSSEAIPVVNAFRAAVASRVQKLGPVREASVDVSFDDSLHFG